MPQVPGLVPTAVPSSQGAPELNVNVPTDAFGGAVGHALSGLGQAAEQFSDKIWARAVELQTIQNKTEADRADVAYMERAGLLHAEFNSLQGDNAAKAFPEYIKNLKAAREEISKGLSNDASRRMYDSATLSTMGRTIFNGAGHAASQAKASQIDAVDQKRKMIGAQAITADSEQESRYLHNESQKLTVEKNKLQGRESSEAALYEADSAYLAARIQHIAKTDPKAAQQMLIENKPRMGAYFGQTQDIVLSSSRAIGAANIARGVWSGNSDPTGEPKASLGEMETQARKEAAKQFPNDEIAANHAVNAVSTLWNQRKQAQNTDRHEARNDVYSLMLSGKVNNLQELLATPEGWAAYNKLDPVQQKSVESEITRYVKAKGQIVNDENYQKLWRMAKSDDPNAVKEFLNTPLADQAVSQAQLEKLTTVRKQLTKDPKTDPRIIHAMTIARATSGEAMQSLRIYKRSDNPDEYDKFTGALYDSLENWTEVNKKPPTDKQIKDEIIPPLLQSHSVPRLFGLYTGKEQNYVVPESFSAGMKAKATESGITIDDRQIRRAYIQTLMKKNQQKSGGDVQQ